MPKYFSALNRIISASSNRMPFAFFNCPVSARIAASSATTIKSCIFLRSVFPYFLWLYLRRHPMHNLPAWHPIPNTRPMSTAEYFFLHIQSPELSQQDTRKQSMRLKTRKPYNIQNQSQSRWCSRSIVADRRIFMVHLTLRNSGNPSGKSFFLGLAVLAFSSSCNPEKPLADLYPVFA